MTYSIEDYQYRVKGGSILDSIADSSKVSFVSLKIKATHSGKINSNNVFYTPRSMMKGVSTLVLPFEKHLQRGHNGEAIGKITEASYVSYEEDYPEVAGLIQDINTAKTPKDLVFAVKALVDSPTYKSTDYKGLGLTEVHANLYDEETIKGLRTGENEGKVSIGGKSRNILCSICSSHMGPDHPHKRGRIYNSERCFAIYDDMKLDHIGFVPNPADSETASIILDSEDGSEASIQIETYKIQDEQQGTTLDMKKTFSELKEFVKSSANLVGLLDLPEEKTNQLVEELDASLKGAKAKSFLLSEDKLLPVSTSLGVAVSKLAVDQLDDEAEEKEALSALLETQVNLQFTAESPLTDFIKSLTTPKEDDVTPPEEGGDEDTAKKEDTTPEIKDNVGLAMSPEDIQAIATAVTENLKGWYTEAQATIQDSSESAASQILISRNSNLEVELRTLESTVTELTNEYRAVIIDQILGSKGLDKESEYYKDVLSKRSIQELKNTLVDFSFVTEGKSVATPEGDKAPAKAPLDTASIQDAITQGEGEVKDLTTDAASSDAAASAGKIEDSEAKSPEDEFRTLVKSVGLAKALKTNKIKR